MPDLLQWRSLDIMGKSLVVGLAQLVERQIVVLEVVGSNPTSHPIPSLQIVNAPQEGDVRFGREG
jgi:hypothetical protein